MWQEGLRNHPTMGAWYAKVENRPRWVAKAALAAVVLTVVVPLALLVMAALVVGFVTFLVLGVVAVLVQQVRILFAGGRSVDHSRADGDDGRVNVRVIKDGP